MTMTAVASTSRTQSQATVVTVYGLPTCRYTVETQLALSDEGLSYRFVDLAHDSRAWEFVAGFGRFQTPLVVATIGGRPYDWSGYRPDLITALVQAIAAHRTD